MDALVTQVFLHVEKCIDENRCLMRLVLTHRDTLKMRGVLGYKICPVIFLVAFRQLEDDDIESLPEN